MLWCHSHWGSKYQRSSKSAEDGKKVKRGRNLYWTYALAVIITVVKQRGGKLGQDFDFTVINV